MLTQNRCVVISPNAAFMALSALIRKSSSQLGGKFEHNTHCFLGASRAYPSEQDEQRAPLRPLAQELL